MKRNKKYFALLKEVRRKAYFIAAQETCPLGITNRYEYRKAMQFAERLHGKAKRMLVNIVDRIHHNYLCEGENGYSQRDMDMAMMGYHIQ